MFHFISSTFLVFNTLISVTVKLMVLMIK